MVISGSGDRTVRVWDLATGAPSATRSPATPAGAVGGGGGAGRPPGGHLRRRRRDGAGVGPGHRRPGRRPVHRPHRLGAGGGGAELDGRPVVVSGSDDGTVRVWDLATGTPVGDPFTGHTGPVTAVAVGGAGRAARWWSPAATTDGAGVGPGHRHPGRRPAHRPQRLGARGGGRRSWTAARWSSPAATTDGAGVGPGHRHPGRRPVHRPHRLGARGGGRRSWTAARWWSPAAATGRCGCGTWPPAPRSATRSPATSAPVMAVAVAELDGRPVVVSGGDDGTVRVWDLATGSPRRRPVHRPRRPGAAVAAAELDGRPVVVSGGDDGTVRVWDLATGNPVGGPFTGHTGSVRRGGGRGAGRPPGGGLRRQRRHGAGVGPGHRRPTPGARSPATPAGCTRWRSRSWTAARWWSPAAATGRCGCGTWPPAPRSAARFTGHTGRCSRWRSRSWTAGRWWSPAATTTVRVWDLATGAPVGDPFTGHTGSVHAVAVAELDGRPVVVSGGTTGRCGCGTWPPAPRSATRSPATPARCWRWRSAELDGRPVVVSGSDDGTVRVWDLATGAPVGTRSPATPAAVRAVAVGGAGRPPGGGLRQRRRDGAGVGPGHRRPGRRARSPATPAPCDAVAVGGAGRPPGGGLRQRRRRRCGCGTWPPAPRSVTRSPATAGRCTRWRSGSWTAARWSSPAATTRRCGCGTWPPAPRSVTRSPAIPAR